VKCRIAVCVRVCVCACVRLKGHIWELRDTCSSPNFISVLKLRRIKSLVVGVYHNILSFIFSDPGMLPEMTVKTFAVTL